MFRVLIDTGIDLKNMFFPVVNIMHITYQLYRNHAVVVQQFNRADHLYLWELLLLYSDNAINYYKTIIEYA